VVALALVGLVLTGCSEDRSADSSSTSTTALNAEGKSCEKDLVACAQLTSLKDIAPTKASKATGDPLVLGMINQENTAAGSFPELSVAAKAAADYVNDELGGVDGRPIEIEVCNTKFSPEGSTACAQKFVQEKVPAVLGGIDVFGNGIDTLSDNEIPFVGGIPVSQSAVTKPYSFQWSGGTWGANIAFADYAATELKAKRVAIVYAEFGPISDSAKYGETTLHKLGVDDVTLVPYPIMATDLTSPLQAAAAAKPDAVFILAADTGCKGAFDGRETVGITAPTFYVGACAAPKIVEEAGKARTDGAYFNVEGPVDAQDPDPDAVLYTAVLEKYANGLSPAGAGTVTFRSFMNLYRVLMGLDGDFTAEGITASLKSQRDTPSYMGHSSTCDGKQLAGLPSLCSPQQILIQLQEGKLVQVSDWIEVGEIYGKG